MSTGGKSVQILLDEIAVSLSEDSNKSTSTDLINDPNISSKNSIAVADVATTEPFSSMIDLIAGSFSNCGVTLTNAQKQSAYKAFTDITGFVPPDYVSVFTSLSDASKIMIAYNAFYFFLAVLIICYIGIIAMAIYGWINWVAMLFLLGISTIILYGASIGYRMMALNWINQHQTQLLNMVKAQQTAYQNSIALWPHGLFGVAADIVHNGSGWKCNPVIK
jgi:hypothetical protein